MHPKKSEIVLTNFHICTNSINLFLLIDEDMVGLYQVFGVRDL